MERNFRGLLAARWAEGKYVCVGLDTDVSKIPRALHASGPDGTIANYNRAIIEATADLVLAYKPNASFYMEHGRDGFTALQWTIAMIQREAPQVTVTLDFKKGDIENTNLGYVKEAFDILKADAVTLNPYLGKDAVRPFLEQKHKGLIFLCRTSNKGSGEFQNLPVVTDWAPSGQMPLYQYVAMKIAKDWNTSGNCGLVAGATHPDELALIRQTVGDEMPLLIPGIGAQGGEVERTIRAGRASNWRETGCGFIVNASRSVIFASAGLDFAEAARREVIRLNAEIAASLAS